MYTITANSIEQIGVSFDAETVNRVPIRGTVHLRVQGSTVVLWGNQWEVYLRRSDKFMEYPSQKSRDALIARAITLGTEWLRSNQTALLKAQVASMELDLQRADDRVAAAKTAYEQAVLERQWTYSEYVDAVANLTRVTAAA